MVEIQEKQELLLSSNDVVLRQQLTKLLEQFREELDDHRLAINENTSEIQATNELFNVLSLKLEKLNEKLDELAFLVKGEKGKEEFKIQPLTSREKRVFLAFYTLGQGQSYVTYDLLAHKAGIQKNLVVNDVTGMIQKGVPVLKKYSGKQVFLRLDGVFCQKQAKDNIVGVNTLLSYFS